MKSAGAWTAWIKSRRTPKALYRTFKAGRRPRGARTVPPSHLQPHRPHQLQRIALLHHTRMQTVVKRHAPVLELVLEVQHAGFHCPARGRDPVGWHGARLQRGDIVPDWDPLRTAPRAPIAGYEHRKPAARKRGNGRPGGPGYVQQPQSAGNRPDRFVYRAADWRGAPDRERGEVAQRESRIATGESVHRQDRAFAGAL